MYKLVFTDRAKEDLREIAFGIAEVSKNVDLAINFVREMQKSIVILKEFPNIGAVPRDRILKALGYRFLTFKDYLIFYTTDAENLTVYIIAVFHSKLDYMKVMSKYL